jgi:hypothetical protein
MLMVCLSQCLQTLVLQKPYQYVISCGLCLQPVLGLSQHSCQHQSLTLESEPEELLVVVGVVVGVSLGLIRTFI